MSNSFYQKAKRGRNTSQENSAIRTIKDLIDQKGIEVNEVATTPDELYKLRQKLVDQYGSPEIKKDLPPDPPKAKPASEASEPAEENFELEESDPTPDPDPPKAPSTSSTEHFDLSDFEPVKIVNPFTEGFKQEDMFKARGGANRLGEDPAPSDTDRSFGTNEMPEQVNDSVQNAWDLPTEASDRSGAIERLGSDSAPEEDSDKVALAESTSKKATESLAKQSAKIFEFIVEWGVKKYSKVSDKQLDRMEQEGTIDRNFLISQNKTVADLVDEHNDLIDEIIKVDPDQREDLIEALMLLAEKHQVKMSPESNLAMVVVTIIISLAKAGYDHKQQMKKTLRKVSDTYTMQKTALADAERRNAELQARLDNMEKPEQPDEPVKTLSFDMPKKDKPSLSISKEEPVERNREISEAESELEEITSKVDEGNVKPKKKKVVRKVEQ